MSGAPGYSSVGDHATDGAQALAYDIRDYPPFTPSKEVMTDLSALFPPRDEGSRKVSRSQADREGLNKLVGASRTPAAAIAPARERQLQELVGDAAATTASNTSELRDVVGASTMFTAAHGSNGALAALVGEGGLHTREAGWAAPEHATAGRRHWFSEASRGGAFSFLSGALAVLAIAIVVIVVSLAIYQRATVNPADEAMVSLTQSEAELKNETKVLETATALFDASAEQATSLVEAATPVLAALEPEVAPQVLEAALASRDELARRSADPPAVAVPPYRRGSINEESLSEVGSAIEKVRVARAELPDAIVEVRRAREALVAAIDDFRARIRDVAAVLQQGAAANVEENRAASNSFRQAVTESAARVQAALDSGGDGLAEMTQYKTALDALRTENDRILALRSSSGTASPRAYVPPAGTSSPQPTTPAPVVPVDPVPSDSPAPSPSEPAASAETGPTSSVLVLAEHMAFPRTGAPEHP